MINQLEKTALSLRAIFLIAFIVLSVVAGICYIVANDQKAHQNHAVLALWPPDLVPHPHIPYPDAPGSKPEIG